MVSTVIGALILSATLGAIAQRFWLSPPVWRPSFLEILDRTFMARRYPGDDSEDVVYCPDEPNFRAEFQFGPGVPVYGFPQKGGFYQLRSCFAADLDFLGLDRFHSTPRPPVTDAGSRAEEDQHFKKMRQLRAKYFKDMDDWIQSSSEREYKTTDDEIIRVAWPSTGGVWALKCTVGKADEVGLAALYNAVNMDERSKLIEEMGGTFYTNPNDCPYLNLDD